MYSIDARCVPALLILPLKHLPMYGVMRFRKHLQYRGKISDMLLTEGERIKQYYEEVSNADIVKCDRNVTYDCVDIRCCPLGLADGILVDIVVSECYVNNLIPRLEDEVRFQLLMDIYGVSVCHMIFVFGKEQNMEIKILEMKRDEKTLTIIKNKLDLLCSSFYESKDITENILSEIRLLNVDLRKIRQRNYLEVAF